MRNHAIDDAFHTAGGTIDFGVPGRYVVHLPYGAVSPGSDGRAASTVVQHDGWLGVGWPNASLGSEIAWQGAFASINALEFTENGGTLTIRGQLDPSASYQLLVYAQTRRNWNLLSRTVLGRPVAGRLSTASPLHAGLSLPAGGIILFSLER